MKYKEFVNSINIWVALLAITAVMASCKQVSDGARDKQRVNALRQVDKELAMQSPDAIKHIDEGLRKAKDSLSYYEYYVRKGRWFCQSATPDSMVRYIDRSIGYALRLPESSRRNGMLAYAYNCQGVNYHNFHRKAEDVISLYHSAYRFSLHSDVEDQAPNICANLGDAYVFKNQLVEGAYWYRRALFLVDSLRLHKEDYVSLHVGLANIYLKLNDFDSSLKCYRETEVLLSKMSLSMQAYYLNNYGNYYYYKKDYPRCLEKFLQLKRLLEKNGKEECFDMYLCKLNMADAYLNMDSVAQSVNYLDESEPFFVANQDAEAVYYCNTIRIGQYVKEKNMAAVVRVLDREEKSFGKNYESRISFNLRQIRNQYLQKYYLARGDYRLAYENLLEDSRQTDSLEHNRTKLRASDIMNRFAQDTLRLHHALVLEHKNAELGQARWVVVVVVMCFLLACLLFVVQRLRFAKRQEKNKQCILQLKLEGARNRISPHFVFNVLNNKILHADTEEAKELMGLAQLIRSNLDLSCNMKVTLAAELDFVKQYLKVEAPLVGDDFEYSIDIEPAVDVNHIFIPSMFVQILVENALVHGLRGWEGNKKLQVRVMRNHAGGTCLEVQDNGKGFDIRKKCQKRTGLKIITQTLAVVNEHNRRKMTFALRNVEAESGGVKGCLAQVCIPDGFVI